jgi:ribosomal protein S18 acetylase RimI-like enzyme
VPETVDSLITTTVPNMSSPTTQLHDAITIRDFQPEDIDQVKALFAAGMFPLLWEAFKADRHARLTEIDWRHPFIIPAPLLALGMQQSWDRPMLIYIGAVVCGFFLSSSVSYFKSRKGFHGYVQQSIQTDLSSIPSVYQTNGGNFSVAADSQNQILGMVGGEFKEDNDGGKTYELRRMSVDPRARGQGLAKRLVQQLENELDNLSTFFLTCTSIQYAANRLYQSQGFRLTKEESYPGMALKYRRYEKNY